MRYYMFQLNKETTIGKSQGLVVGRGGVVRDREGGEWMEGVEGYRKGTSYE